MEMLGIEEAFVVDSNEALELKLIRRPADLDDGSDSVTFKPSMSHQVFSQSENIFGYKDLKVKLYYTSAWLTTYVGIEYSEEVDPEDFGIEADNIMEKLGKVLQPGFLTNVDTFVTSLDKEPSFEPYGELKHSFKITNPETNKDRNYEIYYCNTEMKKFINYHERLQTFLLWYIDGASFIDVDDEKWKFFVLYEKYSTPENSSMYSIAGYVTVYEYYAYPLNVRPRISQVLVLPPYQKQGLCTHLLNTIYDHYKNDDNVIDITVEDPTEEFQLVRDYVDACRCASLSSFRPEKLQQSFSEEMARQAQSSSRINKKQARRVYEILRLKETNMNDKTDYKNYRINVKRRLNIPFQKEQAYVNKMSKVLDPEALQSAMSLNSIGQRTEKLEKLYKELEEQYLRVLKRFKREAIL